jgi:hypothetical protein
VGVLSALTPLFPLAAVWSLFAAAGPWDRKRIDLQAFAENVGRAEESF